MSPFLSLFRDVPFSEFDGENRLVEVRRITEADGSVETEHIWVPEAEPLSFTREYDELLGLFVLICSDGRAERFRDNPRGTWWYRRIGD
jgi:hypothetical protein